MKITEQATESIKNQILDAAFERFGIYGYGKTTMAEIARDCDMSAGNLYRYYTNKTEIGAACAERCMKTSEGLWRDILKQPGRSCSQRLEAFVLEKLHYLHKQFSQHPPLFELVMVISRERRDLVSRHIAVQKSLIAEVLAQGNASGRFHVPNIAESADTILAATTRFISPHFMEMFPLAQLEREAKKVVKLLMKGLEKK
ncbi:MAG: TetR/AcrR family transcriptional regulator [Nitrospinaceae bacterium]